MKRPASDRQYAFVNATTPDRNRDEDVRKLVRTHVMIERCRDKKRKTPPRKPSLSLAPSSTSPPTQALCSQHENLSPSTTNSTSPTDCLTHVGYPPLSVSGLSSYPIEMKPRTHALLRFYMSDVTRRLYPLERHLTMNPLRTPEWFQFASSDDAIIHGMLYAASLLIAMLQGKDGSEEMSYHMSRTIQIINKRLKDGGPLQDSTIIAVSCLALGGATVGNLDSWHTHMKGLKEMIRRRGSMSNFPIIIQTKLRRTDISGAIDCAAKPYLDFQRTEKPTWTSLPRTTLGATRKCIDKLLTACGVSSELVNTMSELAFFTQTINLAKSGSIPGLDPVPFSEDTYWIQYKLLSFSSNSEDSIQKQEFEIDRACRLGALLYMKAILDELPNSTSGLWLGSPILLNQFDDALCQVVVEESNKPLMVWLCLVGGCLSRGGMIREWLISQLEELVKGSAIESFRDKDVALSEVLPLEELFGKCLQQLWVEVFMR